MPDNFIAWRNEYNADKYDRYSLMLPKGGKDNLKRHIKTHGYKSMNDFINAAILEKLERDAEGAETPETTE